MSQIFTFGTNVLNRVIGVEGFTADASGVTMNTKALTEASGIIVLYLLLITLFAILTCVGSARLSYCYNISIGNPGDVAFMFAVLCFFFPHFYYPYFALLLNPLCKPRNRGLMGGR